MRKDNVKFNIVAYESLCELDNFQINGIDANYRDFGDKEDIAPEKAEPYGCGNMQFIPKECRKEILDKYDISEGEYYLICHKLKEALSFGECGWCV